MTQWLPARIRIACYQESSARNYERARMQRNAKAPTQHYFANQAAIDAKRGRDMLFALIEKKLPPSFDGELK